MSKTLILSDLHLGAVNAQADAQLAVLHSDFDHLIINGDTVDHYDFRRFTPKHWAVLNRLRTIAQERDLVLLRGNHDWKSTLSDDPNAGFRLLEHVLGVPMIDQHEIRVGRRKYLILHGDQFDTTMNLSSIGDAADFIYRRVQTISRGTARWLKAASKLVCGVVEQVKRRACSYARAHRYEGVIAGHTHFCCDEAVGDMHYLNTGCWVEQPCTYLLLEGEDIELRQWRLSNESPIIVPARSRPKILWPSEANYTEAV